MTDAADDPRALAREAAATRDPALWVRAATAFLRHERWDEAGHALVEARALGGAALAAPVEEQLGAGALERLELRVVSKRAANRVAWSPDGTRFFVAVEGRGSLDEHTLAGGWRELRRQGDGVETLATDLSGRWLVAVSRVGHDPELRTFDAIALASGALERSVVRGLGGDVMSGIALWGEARGCFVHTRSRRAVLELDPATGRLAPSPKETHDHPPGAPPLLADDGSTTPSAHETPLGQKLRDGRVPSRAAVERLVARRPEAKTPFGKALDGISLLFLSHGSLAAVATQYFFRELVLLDLATGAQRKLELPIRVAGGAWSPSGRRLLLVGSDPFDRTGGATVLLSEPG